MSNRQRRLILLILHAVGVGNVIAAVILLTPFSALLFALLYLNACIFYSMAKTRKREQQQGLSLLQHPVGEDH